jgi:hypothetical protein
LGWKDRCLPEKLAGAVNAAIPHTAMAAFLTKFGRPVEVRSYGSGGAVHNCIHLLWSLTPTICFDGYSTGAGVAGWVEANAAIRAVIRSESGGAGGGGVAWFLLLLSLAPRVRGSDPAFCAPARAEVGAVIRSRF